MKPCPHCGFELHEALVDAINDPAAEESCPRSPKAPVVALAGRYVTEDAKVVAIAAYGFDMPEDAA